jgi:hypothetical protein
LPGGFFWPIDRGRLMDDPVIRRYSLTARRYLPGFIVLPKIGPCN